MMSLPPPPSIVSEPAPPMMVLADDVPVMVTPDAAPSALASTFCKIRHCYRIAARLIGVGEIDGGRYLQLECIVAASAVDRDFRPAIGDDVVAASSIDDVRAACAIDRVRAQAARDDVGSSAADDIDALRGPSALASRFWKFVTVTASPTVWSTRPRLTSVAFCRISVLTPVHRRSIAPCRDRQRYRHQLQY